MNMRKILFLAVFLTLSVRCERTECCVQPKIELQGRFMQEIPNCENEGNPEINCTEWLEFVNTSEVDILYGGGDTVQRFTYTQGADSISLQGPSTSSFRPTFSIRDASTLERNDNGDIWKKG